jgi:hypothetical protein
MNPTSTETEKAATAAPDRHEGEGDHSLAKGHGGHSHWMMIACCVPMVLVAVLLIAGGAGLASLAPLLICASMMALMMGVMSRMGHH